MKESEHPYACPSCEINLEERGIVIAWVELPEHSIGHIEPGTGKGVILMFDRISRNPHTLLQCGNCGDALDLVIEDKFLDPECEIQEDVGINDPPRERIDAF